MTTSGTFSFSPSLGDIFLDACQLAEIFPAAIDQTLMRYVRNQANYMQGEWANKGVELFTVDLQTINLVHGTATYNVPAETVMILDLYVNNGSYNRLITPFSRDDYASIANPAQQGFPTSYWFNRIESPNVTFWPVPDGSATYTVSYYRYRQMQDATVGGALNPEVTYLFLDAYVKGLGARIALGYNKKLYPMLKQEAAEAFTAAMTQNVENVPLEVQPILTGYFTG